VWALVQGVRALCEHLYRGLGRVEAATTHQVHNKEDVVRGLEGLFNLYRGLGRAPTHQVHNKEDVVGGLEGVAERDDVWVWPRRHLLQHILLRDRLHPYQASSTTHSPHATVRRVYRCSGECHVALCEPLVIAFVTLAASSSSQWLPNIALA